MQIQVNTSDDQTKDVDEGMVRDAVLGALERWSDRITRVIVHVRDVNGPKGGDADKQCTMEARLAGRTPVAVTANGPDLFRAVDAAADKLERRIASDLEKLEQRR